MAKTRKEKAAPVDAPESNVAAAAAAPAVKAPKAPKAAKAVVIEEAPEALPLPEEAPVALETEETPEVEALPEVLEADAAPEVEIEEVPEEAPEEAPEVEVEASEAEAPAEEAPETEEQPAVVDSRQLAVDQHLHNMACQKQYGDIFKSGARYTIKHRDRVVYSSSSASIVPVAMYNCVFIYGSRYSYAGLEVVVA
jgi:hypothetical protein